MGVLLLPSKKKKVSSNPVFESLNIVYTPPPGTEGDDGMALVDPSNVKLAFQPADSFEQLEKRTR